MGGLSELTPGNIGFLTAFFAANPIAGLVFGMLLLVVILGILSRFFKLGERNAGIDKATDAHIARLNGDIERMDKRFAQMELSVRERDDKIAVLAGTVQFLTQRLEAMSKDYDRLKVENSQLQAVNAEQRGEIQRLEIASDDSRKLIDTLTRQVQRLEQSEFHRRGERRRSSDIGPAPALAGEKIGEIFAPVIIDPVAEKRDPRDSE